MTFLPSRSRQHIVVITTQSRATQLLKHPSVVLTAITIIDEIHVAPNSETAPTTSTGPGIVGDVEPNLALSPTEDYFILGQSIDSATI